MLVLASGVDSARSSASQLRTQRERDKSRVASMFVIVEVVEVYIYSLNYATCTALFKRARGPSMPESQNSFLCFLFPHNRDTAPSPLQS